MKTTCQRPEINEKLLLYLDKKLDGKECEMITEHLSECSVCKLETDQLKGIDATLAAHKKALAVDSATSACMSPELLVEYADEGEALSDSEAENIASHLAGCRTCSEEHEKLLSLQKDMQAESFQEGAIQGEQAFLRMVSREYPAKQKSRVDFGRLALSMLQKAMERLQEWASDLLSPQLQTVSVRKGKRKFKENVTVIKDVSRGIRMQIEIEEQEGNKVELLVFLTTLRKKTPIEDLRVSLFQDEEEMISLFAEQGKVSLKNIPHGVYDIALFRRGEELKRVRVKTR